MLFVLSPSHVLSFQSLSSGISGHAHPVCDIGMQKVNPDRESASSKWGYGRLSERSGVSENHRILGHCPNHRSRLVADQVSAVKAPLLDVQIPL